MASSMKDIDWDDLTEFVPAVAAAVTMPLTFSIAHGIGIGFILYAAIKIVSGRITDIKPVMAILALAFILKMSVG